MFGIIVFGDSITHGRGEQPSRGWAGRLKNDFESQDKYNAVYNLGIPGDTSTGLLKRIEVELTSRAIHKRKDDRYLTIIAIGANDARGIGAPENPQTNPEVFEQQVTQILSIAKQHSQETIIIGLTPVDEDRTTPYENTYFSNEKQQAYNQILQKLSEQNHVQFIDVFPAFSTLNYKELLEDGVHPNVKGYDELYDIIREQLNI